MIAKTFEIRDKGTFIPVMAVRLEPGCEGDRYLFGRAGYGIVPEAQRRFVTLLRVDGGEGFATSDPYAWTGTARTMTVAHKHIEEHFDQLESGAVVDVEFLMGVTAEPKKSERETSFL
jgi:hypothetical protein